MDSETAKKFLDGVRRLSAEKSAEVPAAADQARRDALREAGKIGLLGLGVGGAAAGLEGLVKLFKSPRKPRRTLGPERLEIPFRPAYKEAETLGEWAGNFLSGGFATDKSNVPWNRGLDLAAGAAGGIGGYHLVRGLMADRREEEGEAELASARRKFEEALAAVQRRPGSKSASDGSAIDGLYERSKEASATDLAGSAANYYGMYAVPAALTAGYLAYQGANKKSRRAVLEKALRRRQRDRYAQSPPEIFAVPVER